MIPHLEGFESLFNDLWNMSFCSTTSDINQFFNSNLWTPTSHARESPLIVFNTFSNWNYKTKIEFVWLHIFVLCSTVSGKNGSPPEVFQLFGISQVMNERSWAYWSVLSKVIHLHYSQPPSGNFHLNLMTNDPWNKLIRINSRLLKTLTTSDIYT